MTPSLAEIDLLLHPLTRTLAREADAILDLRDLLARQGHPGKCVRCFFRLFEAAGDEHRPSLTPLRRWLENHVEIAVRSDDQELEALPFVPGRNEDLEAFCLRSMESVRMDRGYRESRLKLAFRYKAAA